MAHPRVGIAAGQHRPVPRTYSLGAGSEILYCRDYAHYRPGPLDLWAVVATRATKEDGSGTEKVGGEIFQVVSAEPSGHHHRPRERWPVRGCQRELRRANGLEAR